MLRKLTEKAFSKQSRWQIKFYRQTFALTRPKSSHKVWIETKAQYLSGENTLHFHNATPRLGKKASLVFWTFKWSKTWGLRKHGRLLPAMRLQVDVCPTQRAVYVSLRDAPIPTGTDSHSRGQRRGEWVHQTEEPLGWESAPRDRSTSTRGPEKN